MTRVSGTRGRQRLLLIALVAVVAGAVWAKTSRAAAPDNLIIITLDTTRTDRLSPYGFMNVSLPALERLAREGVVFDEATSVAPLTLPAHTSLFTGLVPPHHGVRDNADPALPEDRTTLAEVLAARGFRTGAFVGSVVLDPNRGLRQGFTDYRGVEGSADSDTPDTRQRRGDAVIDDAIRWLDGSTGARFFLWAHLYDAHRPYDPPEPYRSTYAHNPYVGEIAFADAQIGRLIAALEQRGLLDRTAIVVAGDHGESLGEHGERDHGMFVYENVLRVPFIVRAPGLRATRVSEIVRLTDVMPTALDVLGIPAPATDGVSLVDLMTGRRQHLNLQAYAESMYPERFGWSPLRALRDGRYKLIDAPKPELFDLEADPFEETNIYSQRRALAESLTARADRIGKPRELEALQASSPDLAAKLGALGYLASPIATARGRAAVDPKDCVGRLGEPQDTPRLPLPPAPPACGGGGLIDDGAMSRQRER